MAKQGSTYYVFATGPGIVTLKSKDLKTWERGKPVFTQEPAWIHEALPNFNGDIWAPDIILYQGRYHLFYACANGTAKNYAAIGHASNATLDESSPDFKWVDHGKVIQSVVNRDLWQAIDPNIALDENNTPWLVFGSFWDGIKAVKLTPDLMKIAWPEDWHTISRRPSTQALYSYNYNDSQTEGAFIFKHGDYFYHFASFDMCCRGTNSTYHVVVGRSKNLLGPYLDRAGFDMINGNGNDFAHGDGKVWAAMGHNAAYHMDGKDIFIAHAYSIADKGQSQLIVRQMHWDSEGWPSIDLP